MRYNVKGRRGALLNSVGPHPLPVHPRHAYCNNNEDHTYALCLVDSEVQGLVRSGFKIDEASFCIVRFPEMVENEPITGPLKLEKTDPFHILRKFYHRPRRHCRRKLCNGAKTVDIWLFRIAGVQ